MKNSKTKLESFACKAVIDSLLTLKCERNNKKNRSKKRTKQNNCNSLQMLSQIRSSSAVSNVKRVILSHCVTSGCLSGYTHVYKCAMVSEHWLMPLLWSYLMYCVITCINTTCQPPSAEQHQAAEQNVTPCKWNKCQRCILLILMCWSLPDSATRHDTAGLASSTEPEQHSIITDAAFV